MKRYTLKEIERIFKLSPKKVYFLIKKDLIEPVIEDEKIFITEEEIKRYLGLSLEDRGKHHTSFLKTLGPGVITGASDDDPSGIGTYSTVGSRYGLSLAWLALYLLPMMTAVQETCARIGIVTERGLSGSMNKRYGKKVIILLVCLLVVANTINIGADIGAMVASFQLLLPINFYFGATILTLIILYLEIKVSYHRYAKILKWLTITLFAYILTAIIVHPNWSEVARSLVFPTVHFNKEYIAAMVAVMGTTISPYLFFWQTSEEVEDERDKKILADHHKVAIKHEISDMRKDTFVGMSYANIVFLFIVITTASVLFSHGINNIESAEQAAMALKPLAGDAAYLLFTLGIFGVGLLAVPVLAGSSAYAVAELFKWHEGLYRKYSHAKGFYGIIIISLLVGLAMNFLGINPIKALYLAAIVNGVTAPVLLFYIFRLGRDKQIMGDFVNPRWVNIFGSITILLMGGAAITLLLMTFGLL
ncbi:MAG: divalent metal cation transporter [Patescibacteria group bacterium]|jgi:NRAMP (natural resistance-associated macrophage protein)-like metal ion transporter|nr:divalent metal cation transporter [Patescibacteria group bacterium]